MKITFSFPAQLVNAQSNEEAPSGLRDVTFQYPMDLNDYLDDDIADQGVIGGVIEMTTLNDVHTARVSYWFPRLPTTELVEKLCEFTLAQLLDGIGEGGFEYPSIEGPWLMFAQTGESVEIEVVDDGKPVLELPKIAIAARDGDLISLQTLLANPPFDLARKHQGFPALHLAVKYGHVEAVRMLLKAGADANQLDLLGETPLEKCGISNSLSDEQSRDVAFLLLAAGGDPGHQSPNGETAKSYALMRNKPLLASVL